MFKVFILLAGCAVAANVSSPIYTKVQKPCAKDLAAHCAKLTGYEAIACLGKHKDSFSKSCRAAMEPEILQKAKADKQAGANECTESFAKACPGKAGVG